jgi:cytidylate kinase
MIMAFNNVADALVEQVCRQWERRREAGAREEAAMQEQPAFSIAIGREAGAGASSIAQEVGRRLGWTVYDRDLVERIAQEMGLRATLLESLDERHTSWLSESMQQFLSTTAGPYVSESAFFRHLAETILALGTHGECVIVGRGSGMILPAERTLRVRLVAPVKDRVARTAERLGQSLEAAAQHVQSLDHARARFVRDHFRKDPEDPRNFDLVLNTSRFSVHACADLIVDALHRLTENRLRSGT